MKKAKKQRIEYGENTKSKAAELEELLFGTGADPSSIFSREKEEEEGTVADLVRKATRGGGLLADTHLFFEDTRGEGVGSDESGSASSSDSEESGDDVPLRTGQKRLQLNAATRGAPGKAAQGPGPGDGIDDEEEGAPADVDGASGCGGGLKGSVGGRKAAKPRAAGGDSAAPAEQEGQEEQAAALDGEDSGLEGSKEGDEDASENDSDDDAWQHDRRAPEGSPEAAGSDGRHLRETGRAAGDTQPSGQRSGPGRPGGARTPAWSDPHAAAVTIDVAASARLRKLRKNEKQQRMDGAQYEAALRKQHQTLNPSSNKWAAKRGSAAGAGNDDEDEEAPEAAALLTRAGGLTERPVGHRLPGGQIETTRLKDANQHQPNEAVVQAVQFHPNGEMLLTAGLDKKLRLFQVDGVRNPLVQAVHLDDMPITTAAFAALAPDASEGSGGADRVVMAGRRPFFYLYDMAGGRVERVQGPVGCALKSLERFAVAPPGSASLSSEPLVAFCGDSGFLPLVSLRSRQWVASLKMSGNVRAAAFSHDGTELVSTGDDGVVHFWDLRTRRCRLTLLDAGATADSSSLALSPDGAYLATGSKSGVVSVYQRSEVEAAAAAAGGTGRVAVAPAREFMNLSTNVDTLAFSPDSQMLAFASRMKREALRLAHLPSLTVFSNWPTTRSPLHYVHSLDFSPHCGLLAIGNAKGRALLYRLHHYQRA